MKKTFLLLLCAAAALPMSAQQTVKSDQMDDFHAVSVSGNLNVELIPGYRNAIEIELYDTEINKFKWSVSNGVLSATLRPTSGAKGRGDIRIYYKTQLRNISVTDARLTIGDPLVSHMVKISVSGGANVSAAVEAEDLDVEVTGNSVAVVSGSAKYLSLRATERSRLDTRKMDVTAATAEAATGAEIYVKSTERLVAHAKSSATIFYDGNPGIFKDLSTKVNATMGSGVLSIGSKE